MLEIFYCSQDLPGLTSLINVQKYLRNINIYNHYNRKGNYNELSKALSKKGDTLKHLHLGLVNAIPPSFLISLVNLAEISIYNDEKYEDINKIEEFQNYFAISKFPILQSLNITGLSCFKELAMLIEKSKGYVSRVNISTTNKSAKNTGLLINSIAINCPKIKFLRTYLEPQYFINVKSLLLNCRYLKFIEFYSLNIYESNDDIGDELLDILTNFSPNSLTSISLNGCFRYSVDGLERFLESCRERTLDLFIIRRNHYISWEHKEVITKYIREGVIIYYSV